MKLDTQIDGVNVINGHLALFGPHYIGIVDNVRTKWMSTKRMQPTQLVDSIVAPTNIGRVPDTAFKGKAGSWWVTSATVNETSGHIYIMNPNPKGTTYRGISNEDGYTYENVRFNDMNKDGMMDVVTARYLQSGGQGQMLWLQQPAGKKAWNQFVVHEGMADANFAVFQKNRKKYIIVAGRKFSTIGVLWTLEESGKWIRKQKVRHRVADNYGAYNDIQLVDLDNDGRTDVLTSVMKRGASRGHVLAYKLPDDFVFGQWKRTVIAAGFDREGSPGKAQAFWPDPKLRGKVRPHVFVCGAGDGGSYVLVPTNPKKGLAYDKLVAAPSYGRVGLTYIGDISGDGRPELIIPQEDKIHVYTFPKTPLKSQTGPSFKKYHAMETVENPKADIIPSTRYRSNKPVPKRPLRPMMPMMPMYPMMPYGYPPMLPAAPMRPFPAAVTPPQITQSTVKLAEPLDVQLKQSGGNATDAARPQPVEVLDAGEIVPGANTVEEDVGEFNHPMFSLTSGVYDGQLLAAEECRGMGRQLCTQKQILTGINIGPSGLSSWLLFDSEGRGPTMAKMKTCKLIDVLWDGYKCINGVLETSIMRQAVLSQGLCCGILNGANMTDSYFPHQTLAQAGCARQNQNLCQADELLRIWSRSTLKTPGWGWIREGKLGKLTEGCDPEAELWNGYTCFQGKLEITAPTDSVSTNAPAYCCDKPSSAKTAFALNIALVLISLLLN